MGDIIIGPDGTGPQDIIIDDYSEYNIVYIGQAEIGSSVNNPVWQIAQIDMNTGFILKYADSGNYSNIWSNRLDLVYT
jgi:hypothetical protein